MIILVPKLSHRVDGNLAGKLAHSHIAYLIAGEIENLECTQRPAADSIGERYHALVTDVVVVEKEPLKCPHRPTGDRAGKLDHSGVAYLIAGEGEKDEPPQ